MGRRRRKPAAAQGVQLLPRNKQMLQLFLNAVTQFLKEQDGLTARQQVRLRQMRDCITTPDIALQQRPVINDLRELAIKEASSGLTDPTIFHPYFLTPRIEEMVRGLAAAHADFSNSAERKDTLAAIERLETMLALRDDVLAEYRAFRDVLVNLLKNTRADVKTDARNEFAEILANKPEVARLYRELEAKKGQATQTRIAIDFTEGDTKKASTLLRYVRKFRTDLQRLETAIRADNQKSS